VTTTFFQVSVLHFLSLVGMLKRFDKSVLSTVWMLARELQMEATEDPLKERDKVFSFLFFFVGFFFFLFLFFVEAVGEESDFLFLRG
jgi:hypothetical protein